MDMVDYCSPYSNSVDNYLELFYKSHIKWQRYSTEDTIQDFYLKKFVKETLIFQKSLSPFLEQPIEVCDVERNSLGTRHNQLFPKKLSWSCIEFQDNNKDDKTIEEKGIEIHIKKSNLKKKLVTLQSAGCYANFGANISQLSWCPNITSSENEILACLRTVDGETKSKQVLTKNEGSVNIIQIWDYGSYANLGSTTELKYSLLFDKENIINMLWISPNHLDAESIKGFKYTNINNQLESPQSLYGHLLLVCADKFLRIIPVPKFSKEQLDEFSSNSVNSDKSIVLKIDDCNIMRLAISSSYSIEKEDRFGNPTCVDWKSQFCSKLVVGYSRGFVALYDLSCTHFTRYDNEHHYLIPVFKKRVAYDSIKSISFSPMSWQQFNVSVVSSKEYGFNFTIDITSSNLPVDIIRSEYALGAVLWPRRSDLLIAVPETKDKIVIKTILTNCKVIIPISGIQSVQFCDYLNSIIVATEGELIIISLNHTTIVEALTETKDDEDFSEIRQSFHYYRCVKSKYSKSVVLVDCESHDDMMQLYDQYESVAYPLITNVAINPNIQAYCWAAVALDCGLVNLIRLTNRDVESVFMLPSIKPHSDKKICDSSPSHVLPKSKKTSNVRSVNKSQSVHISKVNQRKIRKNIELEKDSEIDSEEKMLNQAAKRTCHKTDDWMRKKMVKQKTTFKLITDFGDDKNNETSESELDISLSFKDKNRWRKTRKIIDSDSSSDSSKTDEMRDEIIDYNNCSDSAARNSELTVKSSDNNQLELDEEVKQDGKNLALELEEELSKKSPVVLNMGEINQSASLSIISQQCANSPELMEGNQNMEHDLDWFNKVSIDKVEFDGERNEHANIMNEIVPEILDKCQVKQELEIEKELSENLVQYDSGSTETSISHKFKEEKSIDGTEFLIGNDDDEELQDFVCQRIIIPQNDTIKREQLVCEMSHNDFFPTDQYPSCEENQVGNCIEEENSTICKTSFYNEDCEMELCDNLVKSPQNVSETQNPVKTPEIVEIKPEEEQSFCETFENDMITEEHNIKEKEHERILGNDIDKEKQKQKQEEEYSISESMLQNEIKDEEILIFSRILGNDLNKNLGFLHEKIPGIDDTDDESYFVSNKISSLKKYMQNSSNDVISVDKIVSDEYNTISEHEEQNSQGDENRVIDEDMIQGDKYSIVKSDNGQTSLEEESILCCHQTFVDPIVTGEQKLSRNETNYNLDNTIEDRYLICEKNSVEEEKVLICDEISTIDIPIGDCILERDCTTEIPVLKSGNSSSSPSSEITDCQNDEVAAKVKVEICEDNVVIKDNQHPIYVGTFKSHSVKEQISVCEKISGNNIDCKTKRLIEDENDLEVERVSIREGTGENKVFINERVIILERNSENDTIKEHYSHSSSETIPGIDFLKKERNIPICEEDLLNDDGILVKEQISKNEEILINESIKENKYIVFVMGSEFDLNEKEGNSVCEKISENDIRNLTVIEENYSIKERDSISEGTQKNETVENQYLIVEEVPERASMDKNFFVEEPNSNCEQHIDNNGSIVKNQYSVLENISEDSLTKQDKFENCETSSIDEKNTINEENGLTIEDKISLKIDVSHDEYIKDRLSNISQHGSDLEQLGLMTNSDDGSIQTFRNTNDLILVKATDPVQISELCETEVVVENNVNIDNQLSMLDQKNSEFSVIGQKRDSNPILCENDMNNLIFSDYCTTKTEIVHETIDLHSKHISVQISYTGIEKIGELKIENCDEKLTGAQNLNDEITNILIDDGTSNLDMEVSEIKINLVPDKLIETDNDDLFKNRNIEMNNDEHLILSRSASKYRLESYSSNDEFCGSSTFPNCSGSHVIPTSTRDSINNFSVTLDNNSINKIDDGKSNEKSELLNFEKNNKTNVMITGEIDKKNVSASLTEDTYVMPETIDYFSLKNVEVEKTNPRSQSGNSDEPQETIIGSEPNLPVKIQIVLDTKDYEVDNYIDFEEVSECGDAGGSSDAACCSLIDDGLYNSENEVSQVVSKPSDVEQKIEECIDLSNEYLSEMGKHDRDDQNEFEQKIVSCNPKSRENVFQFINKIQDNYLYYDKSSIGHKMSKIVSTINDFKSSKENESIKKTTGSISIDHDVGNIEDKEGRNDLDLKKSIWDPSNYNSKNQNSTDKIVNENRFDIIDDLEDESENLKINDGKINEIKMKKENHNNQDDIYNSGSNEIDKNELKLEIENLSLKDQENVILLCNEAKKKRKKIDLKREKIENSSTNETENKMIKEELGVLCSKNFENYKFLNIRVVLVQDNNLITKNETSEEMKKKTIEQKEIHLPPSPQHDCQKKEIINEYVTSNDTDSERSSLTRQKRRIIPSAKYSMYKENLIKSRMRRHRCDGVKTEFSYSTSSSIVSKSSTLIFVDKDEFDEKTDIQTKIDRKSITNSDRDETKIFVDKGRNQTSSLCRKRKITDHLMNDDDDGDPVKKQKIEKFKVETSTGKMKLSLVSDVSSKRSQNKSTNHCNNPLPVATDIQSPYHDRRIQGVRSCPRLRTVQMNKNYHLSLSPVKENSDRTVSVKSEALESGKTLRLSKRLIAKTDNIANTTMGSLCCDKRETKTLPQTHLDSSHSVESKGSLENKNFQDSAINAEINCSTRFNETSSKNRINKIGIKKSIVLKSKSIQKVRLNRLKVQRKKNIRIPFQKDLSESVVTSVDDKKQRRTTRASIQKLYSNSGEKPVQRLTRMNLKKTIVDNCAVNNTMSGIKTKTRMDKDDGICSSDYNADGSTDISNSLSQMFDEQERKRKPVLRSNRELKNCESRVIDIERYWWHDKEFEVELVQPSGTKGSKNSKGDVRKIKGIYLDREPILNKIVQVKNLPGKSSLKNQDVIVKRIIY